MGIATPVPVLDQVAAVEIGNQTPDRSDGLADLLTQHQVAERLPGVCLLNTMKSKPKLGSRSAGREWGCGFTPAPSLHSSGNDFGGSGRWRIFPVFSAGDALRTGTVRDPTTWFRLNLSRKLARWVIFLTAGFAACGAVAQVTAPVSPEEFKIPFWYKNISLHSGFGYKDNVVLSSFAPKGSGFWSAGGDVLVYRLPSHGWQFNAFASLENVGYLDQSTGVANEQVGLATAQLTKDLGQGWRSGLSLSYTFSHQVLDVTATQTNQFTIGEVLGHNATARWYVRKDFKANWVEAEASVTRQFLKAPLDNTWQAGPRLTAGHSYGRGSDVTLSYQWYYVAFDTREQVDAMGFTVPDTSLRFHPHVVELSWHHVWDEKSRWHTTTKAGLELSLDNSSGYFDYRLYRLSQQISYTAPTWQISLQLRLNHYDYSVQTVSLAELTLRQKTTLSTSLRAEKNLGKAWKIYASHAYDQSLSNVSLDRYRANTTSAGVEWHF